MKKILYFIVFLVALKASFAQQISVQNNELKYRTTLGIKTAADKDVFQSKINSLSSRIIADSLRLNADAVFYSLLKDKVKHWQAVLMFLAVVFFKRKIK